MAVSSVQSVLGSYAYSDDVLEETPARITRFLTGIGGVPEIRTLLAQQGLTAAAIEEGRSLLLGCLAAPEDPAPVRDTPTAKRQREALAELDQLDEPIFGKALGVLNRYHPEVAAYLFGGLTSAGGSASVQAMANFLYRVRLLETGGDEARAGSREDDRDAVVRLAERGITTSERARLEALVELARGATDPLPPATAQEERRERLVAARLWYEDWATVARIHVKKRGYRVRLGLASRRTSRSEDGGLEVGGV